MADRIISVQVKVSGGQKSPIVTGDKRLTLLNLARMLYGLNQGSSYKQNGDYVAVQASMVAASATVTIAAPTTGQTVTIAGTAMTAQQSRARATCTPSTALAGDTLVVNGVTFTGTAGAVTLGDPTFSVDTSDAAVATSITAQVNAYASSTLSGLVTALNLSAGVVTLVAVAEGTSGNAITLTSSGSTLAVTGSGFLAGGAAVANNKFDFGSGNAYVAASLTRAVNASTTAAIRKVIATTDGVDVVTLTAKVAGVGSNAITLTSSDGSTLAVTGSGFLANGSEGAATRWAF